MENLMADDIEITNIILLALGLLLIMVLAIVIFFYFSRKKIIKTQLEKATLEIEYQKEIIQSTIITQEKERKRIAQDLHDAISSKLNIVSLNANLFAEENITSAESNKIAQSILNITGNVLESSRQIAHDLLPATLDKFGLAAALEELCEEISDTKKFEILHEIKYDNSDLSSEEELHLFRIVQELFNNTAKHSEAKKIELDLQTVENKVSLRYKDNGKGFDMEKSKSKKGLGMSGIENRAIILNGNLNVVSEPGKGIEVKLEINK